MNEIEQEKVIRRILVALDASTHSLAALDAAAGLAASLGAELIGLFVEDENLLHLAGLPFSREVSSSSATSQPMSTDKMEQALRLQASQARHALERAAERVRARWSFRIVRGQVTASVLTAALDADLLALGRVSRPVSRRSRLGSTARAASIEIKRSVLLMQHGSELNYPVLITYDGSPPSRQALTAAAQLAQASAADLVVLILSATEEEHQSLMGEVKERVSEYNLSTRYHRLRQATVNNLARIIKAAQDCVLVLGGDNPLLRAEAIQELLDETDCPVMLVR